MSHFETRQSGMQKSAFYYFHQVSFFLGLESEYVFFQPAAFF